MAIGGVITQPKKRKFFPDQNGGGSSLFSGLDTGLQDEPGTIGGQVKENLSEMLSGDAFDSARTQTRETLARGAQNLRVQSGQQNATALGQGAATKAQGQTEQTIFQGLADTELGLNVEEQAMKERGIGLATDIAQVQQAGDIQREQIAEGARQFGISTAQAEEQFNKSLELDYEQLSQADRQFLATMGLNREQFEAQKQQFQQNLEQEGRLTMAQLNVQEKGIVEEARQFDDRLDFDEWATNEGFTENERKRVWQAIENEKVATNASEIATMHDGTERWKTEQLDILTRAGWDAESSERNLDRLLTISENSLNRGIEREMASGKITLDDGTVINSVQLEELLNRGVLQKNQQDFEKEMSQVQAVGEDGKPLVDSNGKPVMIDRDTAAQLWQSSERLGSEAYNTIQADMDWQHQQEILTGNITLDDGTILQTTQLQEILQRGTMQTDEQEFLKDMAKTQAVGEDGKPLVDSNGKPVMIDRDTAAQLWQSSEAAKDRVQQANLQQLQNEFTAKGWNFQSVLAMSDQLGEEQYADLLRQSAVNAGITHFATDAGGNPVYDADGNQVTLPGFKDYGATQRLSFDETYGQYVPGENTTFTSNEIKSISSNIDKLVDDGKAITDNVIESTNLVSWTTSGSNRWVPTKEANQWVSDNKGKIYEASNGRFYEVVGTSDPMKRHSMGGIVFRDLASGIEFKLTRGSEFPGG